MFLVDFGHCFVLEFSWSLICIFIIHLRAHWYLYAVCFVRLFKIRCWCFSCVLHMHIYFSVFDQSESYAHSLFRDMCSTDVEWKCVCTFVKTTRLFALFSVVDTFSPTNKKKFVCSQTIEFYVCFLCVFYFVLSTNQLACQTLNTACSCSAICRAAHAHICALVSVYVCLPGVCLCIWMRVWASVKIALHTDIPVYAPLSLYSPVTHSPYIQMALNIFLSSFWWTN